MHPLISNSRMSYSTRWCCKISRLDWNMMRPRLHIIDFGCGSRSAETSYYYFFLWYLTSAPNLLSNASWMSVCTHNTFVIVLHFSYMTTTWQQPWICRCLRLGSRVKSVIIHQKNTVVWSGGMESLMTWWRHVTLCPYALHFQSNSHVPNRGQTSMADLCLSVWLWWVCEGFSIKM